MDTLLTDEYVISRLQKEALSGKSSERRDKNAPKPNTRFLRNLVRDADSHNAALLAKEKAETRARLKGLEEGKKRSREEVGDDGEADLKKKRREGEREGRWKGVPSGLGGSSMRGRESKDERWTERAHTRRDEKVRSWDSRERKERSSHKEHHSHRRRRSRSVDSRSRSPPHRKGQYRERRRSRSPDAGSRSPQPRSHHRERRRSRSHERSDRKIRDDGRREKHRRHHHANRGESHSPASPKKRSDSKPSSRDRDELSEDSDPLDSLIGPAPPPTSRPRGRGGNATNRSTFDLRFNDPSYNPRADVALTDSEGEKDDWATSLEAVRDRAAWREKGAQRLREAGFGETDVAKFEGSRREKDERDLRWRSKGEGREWDAGKVSENDGDVQVKAAWTKALGL